MHIITTLQHLVLLRSVFLPLFSFRLVHIGSCQHVLGEWLVLIVQQWMVGWLTPWSVPTMTVPPPLALKQQVKRKRRMNRTIRRKAGLSCGIIPEALFIITARRAPSHCGLFRLPLAGSTQIKLAFCRTKTGQRWRRLFVFHSHPGIYLPGKHFFATNTRNTIFLRTLSNNTI